MSTLSMYVQVFPISRPSGRRAVVQPNLISKSNAKRQLFGSPNPGECSAMYRKSEEENEANLRRYELCLPDQQSKLNPIFTKNNCVPSSNKVALSASESTFRDTNSSCLIRFKSSNRAKPYPIQKQITDFYKSQKSVTTNNQISDVSSVDDVTTGQVPQPIQENVGIDITTAVTANESSSSSLKHQCEYEQSQQEIALHTMTTDHKNTKIV